MPEMTARAVPQSAAKKASAAMGIGMVVSAIMFFLPGEFLLL